ncbi:translational machinery component [Neurospora crassa]|uniref:Small ribosomal subunit protein uS11m n=2 Tax=Neurospora crassa TaxID=5141 RepID=RT18_NEUCR|nr:mitochondrial ribosomal protein subunit S18 [Neurospora crassa OR74A]Q7SGU0.1 RecName: Full=Small ribosomal subunit protein uS11m [Neurospora crassa OR74A]6YW5_KK Chain KK, Mitochondrial ribosomal protein subunit S18 [Neurospora crassa OR74A]6YWE_KK Chain KK, Translational machinery component [Neurospora crassa]6YWX_KK Chain KK, Mitochondrial ribosomal protein subunit S18 [Neurospora crassa OR74A]6YWY_KK Chain KK, Translational machinery component [Neurospora crassa]EAA36094.1 mitochondria|eukprot:XP_965330.1 mitochondrial ribosomal protein subunit S18 [Neurospora crassa OR74A]
MAGQIDPIRAELVGWTPRVPRNLLASLPPLGRKTAPKLPQNISFSPPLSAHPCYQCQEKCLPHRRPVSWSPLILQRCRLRCLPRGHPLKISRTFELPVGERDGSHPLTAFARAPRTTEPRSLHYLYDSLPPTPALCAQLLFHQLIQGHFSFVVHPTVATAPRSIWPAKMSRFSTGRLLAQNLFQAFNKPVFPSATPVWTRAFSQTAARRDADSESSAKLMESLTRGIVGMAADPTDLTGDKLATNIGLRDTEDEPYHFHIYSHKHNTHITVTKPNRDALISLSCGNLGFKKSNRKHYDSAYQLGAYVVDKMHQMNLHNKIKKMEVVLRGFGPGREAVIKVLLGNEGRMLRSSIVRVSDATRLKFGGTRSKKPRRLG